MARGATKGRPAAHPRRPRWFGFGAWLAVGLIVAAVAFVVAREQAQGEQVTPPPRGLPRTPDYHALLVSATDPSRILLGTHVGLYESRDGGRSWRKAGLARKDAMNLVRTKGGVLWAAGHNVLFRSTDGGRTWTKPRPDGLPGLDLHGFAAVHGDARILYAAVARRGLYRSRDGGRTFAELSRDVGGGVYGLAATPAGRIFAADPGRGLLASDDAGRTWRRVLGGVIVGVAAQPGNPWRLLATGAGGIFRTTDGGRSWRNVLRLPDGVGPVAWSSSRPRLAYAVGLDRRLYRSVDGGASWREVG